jgi:hypothetical protein
MTLHSSQMGRGGHRDDRRRRLLAEELTSVSTQPAADIEGTSPRNDQPSAHKSENYGDAEFLERQLRLTELIPRRLISYLLLFKVGLVAIAALIALYVWSPQLLGDPRLRPAFADLGSPGSLGTWFASLLLLTAGLLATVVYSVRRHKVDDYHGHYHIWRWAALCWFMMATDVAASLHQGLQQIMTSLTGTRITGDGSIWWLVPALLLLGTTGIRLLIEMRPSRLSTTAFVSAGIAYATALAIFIRVFVLQSEVYQFLFLQGALLAGSLLLVISMGLHARYVVLDAEGELPKRVVKKKPDKKRESLKRDVKKVDKRAATAPPGNGALPDAGSKGGVSEEADEEAEEEELGDDAFIAVDPPHRNLPPALKRAAPAEASSASPLRASVAKMAAGSSDSGSTEDVSKLSKAERKALKKKLMDERLNRERRTSNW